MLGRIVRVLVVFVIHFGEEIMENDLNKKEIKFHNGVAVLPDLQKVKDKIAEIQDPEEKGLSNYEKIAAVCKLIIKYLLIFGYFSITKAESNKAKADFCYNLNTGDSYSITRKNNVLAAFIQENFGINAASPIYRYAIQSWRHACFMGKEILTANFSYYDHHKGTVFFPIDERQVIFCRQDKIEVIPNGSEGVYLNLSEFLPFEYVGEDSKSENSVLEKILFAGLNCPAESGQFLNPLEAAFLMEIYFYFIPFAGSMETRPLLVIHGHKGSGKSSLLKRVGKAIFGRDWNLSLIPRSRRDLETEFANNSFSCFDNVDRRIQKAQRDAFAATATGSGYRSRKLRTDSTQQRYSPRPLIAITTRDPAFRAEDDDILDRAIIIRLESLSKLVPENELVSKVINHRNEILTEMVNRIPSIIEALQKEAPTDVNSAFRIADFALFAHKSAFPIFKERMSESEIAEMLKKVFNKLVASQRAYVLRNPLHYALDLYVQEQKAFPVVKSSKELYDKLLKIDKKYSLGFKNVCKNLISFGKFMSNNEKVFADRYGYVKKRGTGNKMEHTFNGLNVDELEI